jgi:hypothetical protein
MRNTNLAVLSMQYGILKRLQSDVAFDYNRSLDHLKDFRPMQTTVYADGIANLTMLEGIVRFDLINITQTDKDSRTVKTVGAVAMSVPGLLRTYTELSGVLNKLIEQGVVKKTETQDPPRAQEPVQTPSVTATAPETAVIEPLRLS